MAQNEYYPEEVLIEKMERGEYGWLDYFSPEWQEEYAQYCKEQTLEVNNESAAKFVQFKNEQLEAAMESGEA
jgi:hypothetical protein